MSIKRRALRGAPLLVASAGAVLAVGCDGGSIGTTSGNLVAPPEVELCVNATPEEAAVQIDGQDLNVETGCNSVWEGSHEITATAEGYDPYSETVEVYGDTTKEIVLTEASGETGG